MILEKYFGNEESKIFFLTVYKIKINFSKVYVS